MRAKTRLFVCPADGSLSRCKECKLTAPHLRSELVRGRRVPRCEEHGEMIEAAR